MYKKTIGVIICILLVSVIASSVIGTNLVKKTYYAVSYDKNILYVGGTGPGNYTNIQSAIDDASSGDTVFVYEGEYNEQINIDKTISLIGENKITTIVNGSGIGTVITINADYVNINGFTIINGDSYGIDVKSNYSNISDNFFDEHDGNGINIINSDNHTITGNIFHNHGDDCIRAENSDNNIISDNTFTEISGAKIRMESCDFNIISDNQVTYGYRFLYSVWSNDLIITNNTMFGYGSGNAMTLYDIVNCYITGNIISGYNEGLWLRRFNYSTITGNEITNNDDEGIFFIEKCNFNVILNNVLSDNGEGGIVIRSESSNNTIYYNNIHSNFYGIYLRLQTNCNDNIIYHNNLIDNSVNAFDGCSNIWNLSYPSGGNYWDDYTGEDNNGDGVGDAPLNISGGGGNKDYYPLMYPWGEQRPVANYTYFVEYGGYVFNASTSYDRDGTVVSYEWDFGDGTTDNGMVVAHSYNESGTYDIQLTVTDNEGYTGNYTMSIDAVQNYPPDTPTIDGPSSGGWGKPYYFTFQSSDNEGSGIWYFVDWGDGTPTSWTGPYDSGYELSDAHTWGSQETYTVRCRTKDVYDSMSEWAEHEITIPRNRALNRIYQMRSYFLLILEWFQNIF